MLSKKKKSSTFHVAFTLKDDERISSTATVLVTYNPHPFNAPKTFELPSKVVFSRILVLRKTRSDIRHIQTRREPTKREMKSVLYGSPIASGSSEGLSVGHESVADTCMKKGGRTVFLGSLELLRFLFLPFLPPNSTLRLLRVGERRLLAFLHAVPFTSSVAGLHHTLRLRLPQHRQKRAHAVHIFGLDTVNILVQRPGIRQGWPRREEFEEVGREKMCARHSA